MFSSKNEYITFKNGSFAAKQIQLGLTGETDTSSVLTFDGVAVTQGGTAASYSGLINPSAGTIKLTNKTTVENSTYGIYPVKGKVVIDKGSSVKVTGISHAVYVMGGFFEMDASTIYGGENTNICVAVANSSSTAGTGTDSASVGSFVMTGGSKIQAVKKAVTVYSGSFSMDSSSIESTAAASSCVDLSATSGDGKFIVTGSSSIKGSKVGVSQSGGTFILKGSSSVVAGEESAGIYKTNGTFILAENASASGKYGLMLSGGTFVMVGGTLKGTYLSVSMSTTANASVLALLNSYILDGETYNTASNSIEKLYFSAATANNGYIIFGGDSKLDNFSQSSVGEGLLNFAQVSAASGAASTAGFVKINCTSATAEKVRLLKSDFSDTDGVLTGFALQDPDTANFKLTNSSISVWSDMGEYYQPAD